MVAVTVSQSKLWAKETIIWLAPHQQHFDGLGEQGQFNIATDTDNLLLQALPQYQLKTQIVLIERLIRLLQSDQSYCIPNRLKNKQRAKVNLYSLPMKLYPGLRLYWLDNHLSVDLNALGTDLTLTNVTNKHPNAMVGVSAGRSYGDVLDRQIQTLPPSNVYVRHGEYQFSLLVKMFNRNKFDLIIEFPTEMNSILNLIDKPEALRSMALTGVASFQIGYIACSKTEKNRHYIQQVNQALKQLYGSDDYFQAHARYLPQADLSAFKQYYRQIFGL